MWLGMRAPVPDRLSRVLQEDLQTKGCPGALNAVELFGNSEQAILLGACFTVMIPRVKNTVAIHVHRAALGSLWSLFVFPRFWAAL